MVRKLKRNLQHLVTSVSQMVLMPKINGFEVENSKHRNIPGESDSVTTRPRLLMTVMWIARSEGETQGDLKWFVPN